MDDYKINLLYNCTDTTVLYSIANDLLLNKNVLGLLGIWNNCRVSKLPAYRQFVKWCCEKRQQEIIVMLVIINHNNGNIMEEKRLLKYVKTQFISKTTSLITKETHNKLLRLLYYVSMIIEDTESFENVFVSNY